MIYVVKNKTKGIVVSRKAKLADTFFLRLAGLMLRKSMHEEEAMLFYHASSIHTFFMRFPIDIIFLDKEMRVISLRKALKPWRLACCFNSFLTIELPPHKSSLISLELGDIFELTSADPLEK